MTTPRVNVGTKGHCDHGINPMKAAFEAWYDNDDISEPLPDDYTILGKRYLYMGWCAATAEANKRIEALEGEVAELTETVNKQITAVFEMANENDALQANNHDLREALVNCLDMIGHEDNIEYINKVLSATPAESLQAHDDELIEKCAKVCDECGTAEVAARLIRDLKGKV